MNRSIGRKFLDFFKNRLGKTVFFLFAFSILIFFVPSFAHAFNPQITYQGKLTTSSGNSVSNGTYYLKAIIYNASSGGTCIYTASSTTSGTCNTSTSTPITVTSGIFSINLGDTSSNLNSLSSSMFTTSSLYLGITVCTGMNSGCDSEMTPRKRLTSAIYAFEADYLGGVTTSTIGGTGSYIPATDSSGNLKITNSVYIATTTAGQFGVGTTTIPSGVKAFLDSTTAADKLLVIRGNSSQSGNMLELQNNNGRALSLFDSSGYLSIGSGSVTSTLQSASLIVGQATSYNSGKFSIDSSGNTSASGTLSILGSSSLAILQGGFISNASSSVGAGLQVAGALNASGTFQSTGLSTLIGGFISQSSSSINSLLTANSLLTQGNINASGSVFLSGVATTTLTTFAVNPTATLLGGFISNASSSIGGGLNVNGNLSASSSITLGGNILPNSSNTRNLGILGLAFSNLYASSSVNVSNGTSSSTLIGNYISIGDGTNTTILQGSLFNLGQAAGYNSGKFSIDSSGNVSSSGTLQAASLTAATNVFASSTIFVGEGTTNSNMQLTGNTFLLGQNINGTQNRGVFYIDSFGNTSASGTLSILGSSSLAILQGGFISNASSSVGAGLQVAGALNASGTLLVKGNVLAGTNGTPTLGAFGTAFGSIYSSGTLFIGSGSNSSQLTGNSLVLSDGTSQLTLSGNSVVGNGNSDFSFTNGTGIIKATTFVPYTPNAYDLGNYTYKWGSGYFQTNLNISNSSATSTLTVNSLAVGITSSKPGTGVFYIDSSGNATASGSLYAYGDINSEGNFRPSLTNNSNLGTLGLAFSNLFASSSVNVSNGTASTTINPSILSITNGTSSTIHSPTYFSLGQRSSTFNNGVFYVDASTAGNGNISTSGTLQASSLAMLLGGFISNASSSVGAGLQVAGALNASGTLLVKGNVLAGTNGTPTLGAFGTAFGNVFSSGTIFIGAGITSSTFSGNLLSLGDGTNFTSLTGNTLTLGYTSNKAQGNVFIDSSGGISASGTFTTFGTSTFNDFTNIVGKVGNPTHRASLADGGGSMPYLSNPYGIFVRQNFAYIASYGSGQLEIVDISTSSPSHKSALSLANPYAVFVAGNYAYVTLYTSNILQIVDISDPANPLAKGSIANGSGGASISAPTSVFVSGNYAYLTSFGGDKLEIVDISNPANPIHKGSASSTGASAVYVAGKYAYVASRAGTGNLYIYDISNPSSPVLKGSIADGGASTPNLNLPSSIFVSGNYAYVTADADDALEIIDISNPTSPTHAGSITDGGGSAPYLNEAYSVFVSGKYAYVASRTSDALEIVDISNPASPTHKGSLTNNTGGAKLKGARGVFVSSNNAYLVSDGLAGSGGQALEIVDISGASVSNMLIGSASIDTLQVGNLAQFNQGLLVSDGLLVGGNTLLSGDVTIGGGRATTTSAGGGGLTISINQSTTTFTSYVTGGSAGAGGFVFNTTSTSAGQGSVASTTAGTPLDRVLMAVQNAGVNQFLISGGGNVYASGTFNARSSQYGIGDFAEFVDFVPGQTVEPGDVIVVDNVGLTKFRKSDTAYAKEIAGVISDTGAFVIGSGGNDRAPLAMAGLVHTKVTTENGPIKAGDYLVASSKTGYAMRYDSASGLPAGLVGMALETLESGEGKIKVMVNKGLAAGNQASAVTLQASVGADGKLAGPVDLDLAGQRIINVKAIVGAKNKWKIDENGVMINMIKTSQGTKTVYNQQSPQAEIVLSGSGQLQNGSVHIEFDQDTQDIISEQVPLKVSITLTGESEGGIYVSEKSTKGFTVKEMKNGTGNVTLDWTAIARRKGYEFQTDQTSTVNSSESIFVPEQKKITSTSVNTGQQISTPKSVPSVDLPGTDLSSGTQASSSTP